MPAINRSRASVGLVLMALLATVFGAFSFIHSANAATVNATIEGFQYKPNPLSIQPGDTVSWENKDTQPHTITSKTVGVFDVNIAPSGGKASITVAAAGTYDIICTIHANMAGKLIVGTPSAPGTGTGLAAAEGGSETAWLAAGALAIAAAFGLGAASLKARR